MNAQKSKIFNNSFLQDDKNGTNRASTSRHPKFELKNENCKNLTESRTRKTFNKFLYYNLDLHIPFSYNYIFHFLKTSYSIIL
jgi:hypothetical protein